MKPKLLVLTPRFPYPPIGGDRLRIYHLCEQLATDFDLSLLSMCSSDEEMNCATPGDGIFSYVERVYHSPLQRPWGCLSVLPSRTPLQVGYYRNTVFTQRLRDLALKHDGILAHLIRTGDYLKPYSIPKILEMTDSLALSYSRTNRVNLKSVMWSVGYKQDAQRLQQYEKSVIDDFDLVVLVSAVDRDFVASKAGSDKTLVCPAGVDVNVYPFDYSPDGSTIVFIGNNTAYHNIDAVLYFREKVFPAVRSRHPRARFKVVGRIDKKLQTRLARHAGVVVTGQVDNIPNAVRGASVGVCPVRSGAGIQNKLLEYMALGVPAITSSIGLEGLRAMPGRDLLVAQTPGEWADHVCSMLEDPERGRGLAVAARSLVEQHYSWASMIAPLRAAICERLRSRRLPAPEGLPAIERGVPLDSVG